MTTPSAPHWLVISNPKARKGQRALHWLERHGWWQRAAAAAPGPIRHISVAEIDGYSEAPARVIAVGGDGTVRLAAGLLLRHAQRASLAILPAGTGNNLVRGLQLPLDLDAAARVAFAAQPRFRDMDGVRIQDMDSGWSTCMVQSAALGFPALIAARYDRFRRHRFFRYLAAPAGPYVYRVLALAGLVGQRRRERRGENLLELRSRLPGESIDVTVLALFLGNERSLGGNFTPCPAALLDDGLVDICWIAARSQVPYLRIFKEVIRGRHLAIEGVVGYRQTPGPAELEFSEPVPLLVDGDIATTGRRFVIEVLPRHFEVATAPETPS